MLVIASAEVFLNKELDKLRKTIEDLDNIHHIEIGKIIKNPKISDKNPGIIKSNAAKAIAAPESISKVGISFLLKLTNPDLRVFNPSYFA